MLNIQSLIPFPIPKGRIAQKAVFDVLKTKQDDNVIEDTIYKLYGFSEDEILYIKSVE